MSDSKDSAWNMVKALLIFLVIFSGPVYLIFFLPYGLSFGLSLLVKGVLFVILTLFLLFAAVPLEDAVSSKSFNIAGLIITCLAGVGVYKTYSFLEVVKVEIASGKTPKGLFGIWPWLQDQIVTFQYLLIPPAAIVLIVSLAIIISFLPRSYGGGPSHYDEGGSPSPYPPGYGWPD